MSGYDYRRQERRSKSGLMFILVVVVFGIYLGFDKGWINSDTLANLLPGKQSSLPLCEQNGNTPPCVTSNGVEIPSGLGEPTNPLPNTTGHMITFVDAANQPIVGMPVKLWKNGEQIQSQTDANGQVMVYTDGFDPNNRESYIIYGDRSGIINGRHTIVVQ